jgi:RNA polymerase sigma factor (TIGR02999 family)
MSDVTVILEAIDAGDPRAADQLLPLVYNELRQLAAAKLAQEKPGQTLSATALVHEAYLCLVGDQQFANRRHFFATAAEAMRHILVDRARHKLSLKRGGDRQRIDLEYVDVAYETPDEELLAVHEALAKLEAAHPAKAELVKLRFFAGLTGDEAAHILGISPTTADNHWAYARAWLRLEIAGGNNS